MKNLSILFPLLMISCGQIQNEMTNFQEEHPTPDPIGIPNTEGVVVKSRAMLDVSLGQNSASIFRKNFQIFPIHNAIASNISATNPVTVVNAPSTSMTLDKSLFLSPTISNTIIDFGYLQITSLNDNDLKVCGTTGKQKCSAALIRMYTTGTTAAGFYNSADDYGAPITAGQTILSSIGLDIEGALTLQTISIPRSKHTVKLTDFSNPKYNIQSDFTDAGAGTYSTTLVVEYALAP